MTVARKLSTLIAAASLVAAACGDRVTPAPPSAAATGPAASAPAVALKGSLTVWHSYGSGGGAEATALSTVLARIQKANPDLKLTVQDVKLDDLFDRYEREAASGGGPDLFIAPNDRLGREARAGLLKDITAQLTGKLPNAAQVAIDGSKVDGKFYLVPESLEAVAMYHDKGRVATPPATTADLLQAVKDGKVRAGFDAHRSSHSVGWWAAFGGQLLDNSGMCVADTTGVADAFRYFQDLQAGGARWYDLYDDLAADFRIGKVNLMVDGPWASGGYKDALRDNLAVAPLPAGPKGPGRPLTGVDGWYINANTRSADLAVAFALEMVRAENEQVFVDTAGHIPADTAVRITDPVTLKFTEAARNGFPRPQVPQLDNAWGNFDTALALVIQQHADARQAVADACAATNRTNNLR